MQDNDDQKNLVGSSGIKRETKKKNAAKKRAAHLQNAQARADKNRESKKR